MNSRTMWVARFLALLAPPLLIWTGMCDPWWEQVALGVVWAGTLQMGLMTAYWNGHGDADRDNEKTWLAVFGRKVRVIDGETEEQG